ncbi:MAG: undecaprenyl-diphosphate phosphatase [Chloroflexota bacterium]
MSIFESIILGIVQGLTEFIPVSSTAHLLLAQRLLGIDPEMPGVFAYNVLVQWGTLAALVVFYWADLWRVARAWLAGIWTRQPFADPDARMGWYLILGSLPALAAGYVFKPVVAWLFQLQVYEAIIRLVLTVILLVVAERFGRRSRRLDGFTWKDALWVGCAQVLAVIPGASRSGSTIAGGMTRHFDRPSAARFAFLLSLPVMFVAGVYESLGLLELPDLAAFLPVMLAGFVSAAAIGYLAIRWLIAYLAKRSLYDFAIYCAVLAAVSFVLASVWR